MKITVSPPKRVFVDGDADKLVYTDTPRSQIDILRNAEYQIGHKKYLEAEQTLLFYIRNFPNDPMGTYMLGRLYQICQAMHKMRPVGRVLIGDAIARGLKNPSVIIDWAKAWFFDDHPEMAEALLDTVKDSPEFDLAAKVFYLKLFYRCGRASEGLQHVNKWLADGSLDSTKNVRIQHLVGLLQAEVGDFKNGFANIDEGSSNLGYAKQMKIEGTETISPDGIGFPFGTKDDILIFAEQGMGDQLLALFPLKWLVSITEGRIVIEVDALMYDLFKNAIESSFPGRVFIYKETKVSDAWKKHAGNLSNDEIVSAMGEEFDIDAPAWANDGFNIKWTMPMRRLWGLLSATPAEVDQLVDEIPPLVAYSDRAAQKAEEYAKQFDKPLIAVAWMGGTVDTGIKSRSLPLDLYKREVLDKLRDRYELISFQFFGKQPNQCENLGIRYLGDDLMKDEDFKLALMARCEVLVSPINTLCHLMGAIKKPVVILAPYGGYNWHFSNNKADGSNVWYPSATVVQQKQPNDWESVMEPVNKRLSEILKT